MQKDMTITIGGVTLPKYSRFLRTDTPNETDNITLGGAMYTDFKNIRRSWLVKWDSLLYEDYVIIYNLFLSQYQNSAYLTVVVPAYSINVPAKLSISPADIRFNGVLVESFQLIITEQYAFS